MPSYLDFDGDPDANKSGSVPTRLPEGNFLGKWVNDCIRYTNAVIRNLGDACLFLPLDSNNAPDTSLGKYAGDMAFQSAADVNITGGIFTGRGYAFVRAVIPYYGT